MAESATQKDRPLNPTLVEGSTNASDLDAHEMPSLPGSVACWQAIDDAWNSYLDRHPNIPQRWLFLQTMATSVMRRQILAMLGVRPGWRTLDIGTGFGPIPMELATLAPIEALGIDLDPAVLQAAEHVRSELDARTEFQVGSRVRFDVGDAYELTENDGSIDLVTARFVFQHLRNHSLAMSEMARVVKPGGMACVIDVDDGLCLTYPESSTAYRSLSDAMSAMQARDGGGRDVGRRLPSLLDAAGFDIRAVLALPEAAYGSSKPGDLTRNILVDRFVAARKPLVEGGFLAADEFDSALAQFSSEFIAAECVVVTHLAVIGQRR